MGSNILLFKIVYAKFMAGKFEKVYFFYTENLALYVIYIQKKSHFYYFPYYILSLFLYDLNHYAEFCPKLIMYTLSFFPQ